MNQALFGLNQAVAQRSHNRVSGGGFRIGCYASGNLVQGAKRNARLVGERIELSEVVVLDGLANEVHRIHSRMLPTEGNKSNQRQRISPGKPEKPRPSGRGRIARTAAPSYNGVAADNQSWIIFY